MRKPRFLRKAVVPILTVCTAVSVPFVSLASETVSAQDDWERRFSTIQSMVNTITSTEKTPQQTNTITVEPEKTVTRAGNTMAGSLIYRNQNGILDMVEPSKASQYENVYRRTSSSSSSSNSSSTSSRNNSSSSSSSSSKNTSSTNNSNNSNNSSSSGPSTQGVRNGLNSSTQTLTGPTVQNVALSETYYEDYDIYALSIENQYFFYSSIGNSGITDQPVTVDIPADIVFKATKDGVPMNYTSKQPLSENGTYVFQLTVVQNPDEAVSRQNILQASYHFRIQPKVVKPQENTGNEAAQAGAQAGTQTGSQYQNSYAPENYLSNLPSTSSTESQNQSGSQTENQDTWEEIGYGSFDSIYGDTANTGQDGSEDETDENADTLGEPGDTSDETADLEETIATLEKPVYDHDLGMYEVLSGSNGTLYATLPNGMLTNYEVEINTDKISGTVTLLKDGEETELSENKTISDPGNYEIVLSGSGKNTVYSFRILGDAVNDLDYFTLPADVTLTDLYLDDQRLDADTYTGRNGVQRIHFKEDGSYRLVMENGLGAEFEAEVVCDREAPVVQVTESRGRADISYGDPDEIESVVLHSGKREQTLSAITEVTKSGTYTMDVYDRAGNCTTVSFRVKNSMNTAAIVSVALLAVIIGAFALLFIRTKKNTKVS